MPPSAPGGHLQAPIDPAGAVPHVLQAFGSEFVIHNLNLSRIQDLHMAARSVGCQDYARPGSSSHPSNYDDGPLVRTRRCSLHRRLIMNSQPTGA